MIHTHLAAMSPRSMLTPPEIILTLRSFPRIFVKDIDAGLVVFLSSPVFTPVSFFLLLCLQPSSSLLAVVGGHDAVEI